jgi:DNA-binding beta-propeller fold protein YncE
MDHPHDMEGSRLRRCLARSTLALVVLCAAGCFNDAQWRSPDPLRFYFPTGLAVSAGGTTLFVANSDFDLRYSGGTVQAFDLRALRGAIRVIPEALADGHTANEACAAAGRGPNGGLWLNPGPCEAFPVESLVRNATSIGAFASGLLLTYRPDAGGARLFVPVRGDPSITYFDVQDDRGADPQLAPSFALECAVGDDGFCDASHRLGQDPDRTLRGIQLPADPVGIAANADGTAIVTAHQTQQAVSLVMNDWASVPWLSYYTSSMPPGPTEVAMVPAPAVIAAATAEAESRGESFEYREGFAITFRSSPELDIVRYYPDSGSVPPRPYLVRASATPVTTNSSNVDSRGVAIIDDERRACEASCLDPSDVRCLRGCAEIPLRIFMANRGPAALLVGQIETTLDSKMVQDPGDAAPHEVLLGASETVSFYDSVPLSFGPSQVRVGHVIDPDGKLAVRVFVVCFDTRTLFVYDPEAGRVETTIRTGRGPHAVAVDTGSHPDGTPYSYLYVGHFTDSYLGVVDLDMRRPMTYGQMFASIGTPTPPEEAK